MQPIPKVVFLFLAVVVAIDAVFAYAVTMQLVVAAWPTVGGVVTDVSMERHFERRMDCPRVSFRYEVDGVAYDSDQFRYGGFCSSDRFAANSVVEAYVPGEPAPVYVNPSDSTEAYLTAGIDRIEHVGLLALLPFNAFAFGWILEIFWRAVLGRSLTGSVRYAERTAILPSVHPLSFTLSVLLVVGFVLAVLMMFVFEVVSTSWLETTWRVLGALTAASFVGKAVWNVVRQKCVTIDDDGMTMPDGRSIPRDAFGGVGVYDGESRPPHPTYFRPVVLVGDWTSGEKVELPEFPSKEEAERLANWIEEKMTRA